MEITARLQHDASITGVLTTRHAASCQGQPVLLIDDAPHGPFDLYQSRVALYLTSARTARMDEIERSENSIFGPLLDPEYQAEAKKAHACEDRWNTLVGQDWSRIPA